MSFIGNVLSVLIASPSDVAEERDVATAELHRWNAANSFARKLVLSPTRWETHSSPQMGGSAQSILNKELVSGADIIVGIFGTRIGTATEKYASGTVEEIKKHVATGKLAMLYFSDRPVNPSTIDQAQWQQLQAFKAECRDLGLYHEFNSKEAFGRDFGHHLTIELNKPTYVWLPRPELLEAQEKPIPNLSELESKLLAAAASSENGSILVGQTNDGFFAITGGVDFGDTSPRAIASLKQALKRLEGYEYIAARDGDTHELTEAGYARAAEVAKQETPVISEKAGELLCSAVRGGGNILYRRTLGGEGIHVGNRDFLVGSDPRQVAEWREALKELSTYELVESRNDTLHVVTAAGYRLADKLKKQMSN